jgi:glycosyl transferase family 10 (putative fucosyltransferase)
VRAVVATRSPVDLARTPWAQLRLAAAEHEIELVSVDLHERDYRETLVIADEWSRDVQRLVARGAEPAALVCFEPPITAWRVYYHLERISARFPHTFMYEGARERVAPTTWFHPIYFPVPCPPHRPTGLPWPNRRFMVALFDATAAPRQGGLLRRLAGLRYRPIARDRYQARARAIEAFSAREDFDVFAEDTAGENRAATLAKYRFALVYEDARFAGYVTDTILECFFARCIPIYSGAPDVAQYVPPSAFIDVRQFQTFPALERFLERTTEDDARRYVDAAHAFVISTEFEKWCADRFARDLLEALLAVAGVKQTAS